MTDTVVLQGKGSWIRYNKPDERYSKWSLVLHPTAQSLDVIKELQSTRDGISGIKNVLGKDEDGYYMTFSRPTTKVIQGQLKPFFPPVVVNADGSPFGTDKAIGNGSDITIELEVYTHKTPGGGKAKACRWSKMRVDNFIPFERNRDMIPTELSRVDSIASAPAPKF